MKYKKVVASDAKEAADIIKAEMGSDAMIVSTKKVKPKGLFGFLKKSEVEVVAVCEENTKKSAVEVQTKRDIDELKKMVLELTKKIGDIAQQDSTEYKLAEKSIVDVYVEYLTSRRIEEPIAKKIVKIVSRQVALTEENFEHVVNAMKLVVSEYVGDGKSIESDRGIKPQVYVFLGPTGVGKTTTLSKIAANLVLAKKSVGIITLDTYRIAAIEQIRMYSTILDAPLEVAYDESELEEALNKLRDKEYIFIDTAGRGHKMKELKEDFDVIDHCVSDATCFLLLNVNTDYRELRSVVKSYTFLKEYRLLFTKLDEADSYANILNIKVLTGMPLSYFTIGQSVPDDMREADKRIVVDNIFAEKEDAFGSGGKA